MSAAIDDDVAAPLESVGGRKARDLLLQDIDDDNRYAFRQLARHEVIHDRACHRHPRGRRLVTCPALPGFLHRLGQDLSEGGLDVWRAFDAARYNVYAAGHPRLRPLPDFGHAHPLGLLVGNSKALWPHLMRALADQAVEAGNDPVDNYVRQVLARSLDAVEVAHNCHFATDRGHRLVSMLHAAQVAGLASLGPAHIAAHPKHGPWFGLRALLIFDHPTPFELMEPAPPMLCDRCPAPCKQALDEAMEASSDPVDASVRPDWRRWARIRQVCPVGQDAVYGEPQLVYHYTKDARALEAAEKR